MRVRALVDQIEGGAGRNAGEVDDHVRPLGVGDRQRRQLHRLGQEPAVRTELPDRQRRRGRPGGRVGGDLERQEAGVAGVEDPQPVAARLDRQHRPGAPVDRHGVRHHGRTPDRRHVAVRIVRPGEGRRAGGRVALRTVDVERPVLDHQRDLVPPSVVATVVEPSVPVGSRAGQHPGRQVRRSAAQQVEAERADVVVEPGEAERVVVVPQRGGPLVVVVVEGGRPGRPAAAVRVLELVVEFVVAGPEAGEAGRDVPGRRQVPRLRVPVAVRGGVRAVQVGDERDRAGVPAGGTGEVRPVVPAVQPTARVGPVQRRVDRQQVLQVAALPVDELVDPGDPDRPVDPGLDGRRRAAERTGVARRPVAPDRGGRMVGRQDLLAELADRDHVLVEDPAHAGADHGHGRRDRQPVDVLVDVGRVERWHGRQRRRRCPPGRRHQQGGTTRGSDGKQLSSRDHSIPHSPEALDDGPQGM